MKTLFSKGEFRSEAQSQLVLYCKIHKEACKLSHHKRFEYDSSADTFLGHEPWIVEEADQKPCVRLFFWINSDNVSFESGTKDGTLTEICSSVVSYRITLAKGSSYQTEIALP